MIGLHAVRGDLRGPQIINIPNCSARGPDHRHQSHPLSDVGRISQFAHHALDDANVSVQKSCQASAVENYYWPKKMSKWNTDLPDDQCSIGL